jgi:hypothetical protein
MNPRARRKGVVVRELPGELVVYDLERHEAHCLNHTAALVFQGADGQTTVDGLAAILRRELGVSEPERLARLTLERLGRAHLLDAGPMAGVARHSRRDLLRRAGLAAALLPAIGTILAPTAAEAAGTCVQGNVGCAGKPAGTPCYNTFASDCGVNCSCDGSGNCVDILGSAPCP